jgi:LuxR family maltose regulon positive regulatory protein
MRKDNDKKILDADPAGSRSILLAKLSMPRSAKGIARPRLHSVLDEARTSGAVWIVAPGGAGKTTLTATYIAERQLPFLWYQMDKDDADPATFFYYLGLAAKQSRPDQEVFLPLLTPEYLHDIPGFARRYFRQLFALLPHESVVVLDNYQDLLGADVVNEVLRNAIGELPEGSNIIVIGRSSPPPVLARLQVTGELEVITWEDLRFSYDETEAIARGRDRSLDAKIIRTLYERSEGWVAALTLMLKQIGKKRTAEQSVGLESLERIFDFFASEFFDELPDVTRDFLMQTSLLTHITPSMAVALSGNSDAGKILATLHRQQFFTSRRDLSEVSYQYHALFREFLLARCIESYTREQYLELMRRTGSSLEKHGRDEEAIALYLQSQAWAEAIALILAQAPQLLAQARAKIVAGWLQCLPEEILMATPWLIYWRGISQQFVNPFEARATLEKAYAGFAHEGDVMGQLCAASAIIDIVFFVRESLLSTTRWIEVLQKSLALNLKFPSALIEARILSSLFSVLMYMRPQEPQLPRYAERLVSLLDEDLEVNQKVLIGAHLVNYYSHALGDLSNCERIMMRITPSLSSPQVTAVTQMLWRCFCVLPNLLSGEDELAYEMVRPLPALIKENNLPFMEQLEKFYLILVNIYRGDMSGTQQLLERMSTVMNTSQPADVAWLCLARCWYALSQGDYPTAFNQGQASLRVISSVGATLTEIDVSCLIALERIQNDKYDEAESYLAMPSKLEFANSPRLRYQVLLIEAYAYLRKGNRPMGLEHLRKAFVIGRKQNYMGSIYCWFPKEVMTRLCSEALSADIEVDYTQNLILKRKLLPDDLHIENWPWPVSVYTLGSFRLVINGQSHSLAGKAQYKPLKLLKILVALGGQDVKEEKISELLWPDAEGDAAHSAFTTTLSRLRKLLGDDSISVKSGRLTLNKLRCWVDVWVLEEQLERLQMVGVNQVDLRTLADKVVALYRGPFMSDEDGIWVERLRQRLQSLYFRFIFHFGRSLAVKHAEQGKAIWPVEAGPAFDPCTDDYYRKLMASYADMGQSAEVLDVYTQCREILARDLGVVPADADKIFHGKSDQN